MPTKMPASDPDPLEQLDASTRESIESARDLVDEMKVVQEYENTLLDDKPNAALPEHPDEPADN